MRTRTSTRGSALMIATIVVLMAVGIGGAFLAQSLVHSRDQKNSAEQDEALMMCDAGMERARQALDYYRGVETNGNATWSWDGVLTYCSGVSTDPQVIKKDYFAQLASADYKAYAARIWKAGGTAGANTTPAASTIPPSANSTNTPVATDATADNVFIGWNTPYHRGAIHVHVRNNGGAGDTTTHDGDGRVIITVTATLPSGIQRQVEGVFAQPASSSQKLSIKALAAVVSNDKVDMNGNITVDGRDYDYTGTELTGDPGVFGILSTKTIESGGSSAIGGVGVAPPKKGVSTGTISENAAFKGGYPAGPDEALEVGAGTLKASAQASGTYCKTAAEFSALLAANGGKLPDAAIVYCDFDPGNGSFDIGSGNSKASILVVHTEGSTSSVKNLHGNLTGVLLADAVNHVNSGTTIVGMVQLFSPTASEGANVFGNGNASIRFSSAVLADLPAAKTGNANAAGSLTSYRRTL